MSAEKEGSWAREYRQGRAEQVQQQKIANLIALSESQLLPIEVRKRAAERALAMLDESWPDAQPSADTDGGL